MSIDDADALGRYWDALLGHPAAPPSGLDPRLVETVRTLNAYGPGPDPSPAFVARVQEELMSPTSPHPAAPIAAGVNGAPPRPPDLPPRPIQRRPPLATWAVVAAVLLIALLVRDLAVRAPGDGPGTSGDRPVVLAVASPNPALSTPPTQPAIFDVTIPEGWRIEQIAEKYAEMGGQGGTDAFLRAVRDVDRGRYDFLADLPAGASLEGYLFPDTYTFRADDPAADVAMMLENVGNTITPEMRARMRDMGLSLHDVFTFASLVEKEAQVPDERPTIADVYLSRYAQGMRLEADPTVQYAIGRPGDWWPAVSERDLSTSSPYNTYRYDGLPPGPICNPGFAAIQAVLFPTNTGYLYFVPKNDGSGEHAFARTREEQDTNIARYADGAATPAAVHDERFAPDYRVATAQSVNFRAGPSLNDPIIEALPPSTPLEHLNQDAPTNNRATNGRRWMKFRIEDGTEGWLREIDVAPSQSEASSPAAPPGCSADAIARIGGPAGTPYPDLATPETEGAFPSRRAAELPAGPPASAADVAAIRDSILAQGACSDSGIDPALLERLFYTAAYPTRAVVPGSGRGFFVVPADFSSTVAARSISLSDPRVLSTGRIGAILKSPGGSPAFVVFVQHNGRWLIDDFVPVEDDPASGVASPEGISFDLLTSAFWPDYQVASDNAVNLRSGPSLNVPVVRALVPTTPIEYLGEDALGTNPNDGRRWMKVRVADGTEGWIRQIDVEPYRP